MVLGTWALPQCQASPGPDPLRGLAGQARALSGLHGSRAGPSPSKPQGGEEKPAEARAQPRKSPLCSGQPESADLK